MRETYRHKATDASSSQGRTTGVPTLHYAIRFSCPNAAEAIANPHDVYNANAPTLSHRTRTIACVAHPADAHINHANRN